MHGTTFAAETTPPFAAISTRITGPRSWPSAFKISAGYGIWALSFVVCVFLAQACMVGRKPTPTTANVWARGSEPALTRVEVELDIFSGMPNPTWVSTNGEANVFVKKLAEMARTSATELPGNLGYRGFVIQVMRGINTQVTHVQTGSVHMPTGATSVYARDEGRELERWLLNMGKPHLKDDLFRIVEREFR